MIDQRNPGPNKANDLEGQELDIAPPDRLFTSRWLERPCASGGANRRRSRGTRNSRRRLEHAPSGTDRGGLPIEAHGIQQFAQDKTLRSWKYVLARRASPTGRGDQSAINCYAVGVAGVEGGSGKPGSLTDIRLAVTGGMLPSPAW